MVSISNNNILQYISIPSINNTDFVFYFSKSMQLLPSIPLHHNSPFGLLFLGSSTNSSGIFLNRPRLRSRSRFFLVPLGTVGDSVLKIVMSDGRVNNARSMGKSRLYSLISILALSRQAWLY